MFIKNRDGNRAWAILDPINRCPAAAQTGRPYILLGVVINWQKMGLFSAGFIFVRTIFCPK